MTRAGLGVTNPAPGDTKCHPNRRHERRVRARTVRMGEGRSCQPPRCNEVPSREGEHALVAQLANGPQVGGAGGHDTQSTVERSATTIGNEATTVPSYPPERPVKAGRSKVRTLRSGGRHVWFLVSKSATVTGRQTRDTRRHRRKRCGAPAAEEGSESRDRRHSTQTGLKEHRS